jgi:hypothetical protein
MGSFAENSHGNYPVVGQPHSGQYKFVKHIEKTTLGETSFPEQQQELLFLLKTFRQVRIEAQSLYNPTVQSLKISVIESLEAELSYLEQKEKLYLQSFKATNPEAPSKFYFKVAVTLAELMFFFRVMLEVALISTKFNSMNLFQTTSKRKERKTYLKKVCGIILITNPFRTV